jgi:hypothetical protein
MKKYFFSLVVTLATILSLSAAPKPAKVTAKATGPSKAIVSGQSFNVKINFSSPTPIEPMCATFFSDEKQAPKDFATKAKLTIDAKWKTVRIKVYSFPQAMRNKTEQNVTIDTKNWPAGDYLIWVACYYRKPGTTPYLNSPAKFSLTIIEKEK